MITSIALLIVAIANAVTVYYSTKRMDKLQDQINDLGQQIYDTNSLLERSENLQRAINDNLDKQIKSQYSHFTSRIDKLKNDVLQNTRQY
jgi:predicted Holliday junction resolvase-like endonuclease